MIAAPARAASRAVAACSVSTDTTTPSAAKASTTAPMRAHSSSALMRVEFGRVDSPPTSIRSAPAATISRAWRSAAATSA